MSTLSNHRTAGPIQGPDLRLLARGWETAPPLTGGTPGARLVAGACGGSGSGRGPVGGLEPVAWIPPERPAIDPALTPARFAALYQEVRVPFLDPDSGCPEVVTIRPNHYSNPAIAGREPNAAAFERIRAAARRGRPGRVRPAPADHLAAIQLCRMARGSPFHFALTVGYALSLGILRRAEVQGFVDDFSRGGCGLHCVGFVDRYFHCTRSGWRSAVAIPNYAVGSRLRRSLAAIQPLDVLDFESSPDHIALIDRPAGPPREFVVAESTGGFGPGDFSNLPPGQAREEGGGVTVSRYRFDGPDSTGLFQVVRGSGSSRVGVRVYAPPGG